MKKDYQSILQQILENLDHLSTVKVEDIPDIPLYMDQVTTFMEDRLGHARRSKGEKIMTKTMINNYAKNKLLPSPEKKKYSRDHILVLLYIYYFKGILSLQDIQSVLTPLTDRYFGQADIPISDIYRNTFDLAYSQIGRIQDSISEYAEEAGRRFKDAGEEDRQFLQLFLLITSLGIDVYIKKRVIEQLIDDCLQPEEP